jgi:hypothetical protein
MSTGTSTRKSAQRLVTGRLDRSGAIFPLLATGHIGPRLRRWPRRQRLDRAVFAERHFSRSRLRATSGHGSANGVADRPDRALFAERHFSRSRRFAAGRSGHGSANGVADRPDRALFAERHFSRSRRFAAGRSGHGSANGVADRPDRALFAEPLCQFRPSSVFGHRPRRSSPAVYPDSVSCALNTAGSPVGRLHRCRSHK